MKIIETNIENLAQPWVRFDEVSGRMVARKGTRKEGYEVSKKGQECIVSTLQEAIATGNCPTAKNGDDIHHDKASEFEITCNKLGLSLNELALWHINNAQDIFADLNRNVKPGEKRSIVFVLKGRCDVPVNTKFGAFSFRNLYLKVFVKEKKPHEYSLTMDFHDDRSQRSLYLENLLKKIKI